MNWIFNVTQRHQDYDYDRPQQWLWKGNVFTGMCHSFCPQGREVSASMSKGDVPLGPGGVHSLDTSPGHTPMDTPHLWTQRLTSGW